MAHIAASAARFSPVMMRADFPRQFPRLPLQLPGEYDDGEDEAFH